MITILIILFLFFDTFENQSLTNQCHNSHFDKTLNL